MGESLNLYSTVINRILKTFFYLLYHRFAWAYDFVATAVSVGMWNEWVLSIIPYLEGPKVLELGHGPGHLLLTLKKNSIQSQVILLDDPHENEWIPKIDSTWSGAIPATLMVKGSKRKFYERSFNEKELENEILNFKNLLHSMQGFGVFPSKYVLIKGSITYFFISSEKSYV